jgi:hypothetical protein
MKRIEAGHYQGKINGIEFTIFKNNTTEYTTRAGKERDYVWSSKANDWVLIINGRRLEGLGTKKQAVNKATQLIAKMNCQ